MWHAIALVVLLCNMTVSCDSDGVGIFRLAIWQHSASTPARGDYSVENWITLDYTGGPY